MAQMDADRKAGRRMHQYLYLRPSGLISGEKKSAAANRLYSLARAVHFFA
jgi:hypothetical protein